MADIDAYAVQLFEEAKRFLEKAQDSEDTDGSRAYLHAAVVLSLASLEAHVNAIADEFLTLDDLSLLDESILAERDVALKNGVFEVTAALKMYRLDDRIRFLFCRFTTAGSASATDWWSGVKAAMRMRNNIIHPKADARVTESSVTRVLQSELDCLNALYKALYKKAYPGWNRGLSSKLSF